jgi:hypothetical protein
MDRGSVAGTCGWDVWLGRVASNGACLPQADNSLLWLAAYPRRSTLFPDTVSTAA